jgi:myo-inositol 2-dehydrogenase/D-chiro-inositol 1-dehydrogenase
MTRYAQAYANELASFIVAIEKGSAISPSGADGFAALALADAALKSVKEKRQIAVA